MRWWPARNSEIVETRDALRHKAVYECCDTIQAACNLMDAAGATQADVANAMDRVHRRNVERGCYGTTGPAR